MPQMIFGTVFTCGSAFVLLWMQVTGQQKNKKDMMKVLCLTGILCMVSYAMDFQKNSKAASGVLDRNNPGEEAKEVELLLNVPGLLEDYAYTVHVEPQYLRGEERERLFDKAKKEAEIQFIGDNTSVDEICQRVELPTKLQNGQIKAAWDFEPSGIIGADGSLHTDQLDDKGQLVMVSITLQYGEESRNNSFGCMVYPEKQTPAEKLLSSLKDYLEKSDKENGKSMTLPQKLDGYVLYWSKPSEHAFYLILLLGSVAAVMVYIKDGLQEQKSEQKRREALTRQYPEMVSRLSLLLGSGMTLSNAWVRIVKNYEKQLAQKRIERTEIYEQMLLSYREMQDGMGELNVYERFGERCGTPQYRKFTSLVMQNVRKGSSSLSQQLEREVDEAFALRKNHAKKAGEEAGTKLLLPMMMMLCVVLVIILVPAVMSFKM